MRLYINETIKHDEIKWKIIYHNIISKVYKKKIIFQNISISCQVFQMYMFIFYKLTSNIIKNAR